MCVGDESNLVMGKYSIGVTKADLLGQGASSLCFRARHSPSGAFVAVKVSKVGAGPAVVLRKFRRQLATLLELQRPLRRPTDDALWHEELTKATPTELFVQLLDYSRTIAGEPGHDPIDGGLYIVTDLARESLKDYLCRTEDTPSQEFVRGAAKAITTAVAALHSKGLVHLDVKPANLMLFGRHLKLIDVDGCSPAGAALSSRDNSNSVSFAYCAPEVARWVAPPDGIPTTEERSLPARPSIDVWSVALVLCELVTSESALGRQFAACRLASAKSADIRPTTGDTEVRYLHWLGSLERAPLSDDVRIFDADLHSLIAEALDPEESRRVSLARQLSHSYFDGSGDPASALRSWSSEAVIRSTNMDKLGAYPAMEDEVVDMAPVQFMVPTTDYVRDLAAQQVSSRRSA